MAALVTKGSCLLVVLMFVMASATIRTSANAGTALVAAEGTAAIATVSRNNYVIFAQGCVPLPGDNGQACTNPPQVDLHNPIELLRRGLCMTPAQYETWSATHVQFVRARDSNYQAVQAAVQKLDMRGGSLFLIGHSAGGAAIANYLQTIRQGVLPLAALRGAYILDAPLAQENLFHVIAARWAGFSSRGQLAGLGAWAAEHNIDLEVISYADDWAINPLGDVADIRHRLVLHNPAFHAGPWELMLKHNYALFDFNGTRDFLGSVLAPGNCQA